MKRPLVVITAGFVLGEVLACVCRRLYTEYFFWFAGVLFLTVLGCQAVFKQECHVQDASAYFCVCFWRDDGRKFFRRQVRDRWSRKKPWIHIQSDNVLYCNAAGF